MKNIQRFFLTTSAVLLLAACGNAQPTETEKPQESGQTEETTKTPPADQTEETEETEEAAGETGTADTTEIGETEAITVNMVNSDGEEVGTAIFKETPEDGVTIELDLEGIPAGEYGMHIHEVGKATPPTFEDAGSHFNPTDVEHGKESETGPHVGDLPNLTVPENGIVQETIEVPGTTFMADGENTLNTPEGTSLIIHTGADDYKTQPTGDSGDRMIGGVIFPGYTE